MSTAFCAAVFVPHSVETYGMAVSQHYKGAVDQVQVRVTLRPEKESLYS